VPPPDRSPLKVLVVHNRYRSAMPSGENILVDTEVAMLRAAGVDVGTYLRESDDIEDFGPVARVGLAFRPVISVPDVRRFRDRLRAHRPDVVHLHNPYPLISPWVVRTAAAEGVPVVQSVHNLRHVCANGLGARDGRPCRDCIGSPVPWPAVVHRCYRDSRSQSTVMAAALAIHRSTWRRVDRFLVSNAEIGDGLVSLGVPRERVVFKANAVTDAGPPSSPAGCGFLFASRLSEEKGVRLLIDAWARSGLGAFTTLTVTGDGPLRPVVERVAGDPGSGVSYLGPVEPGVVAALGTRAAARVVPSLWFEGFPVAVVESFSRGRPVVATAVGHLRDLVTAEVGWSAEPTPAALARALVACAGDADGRQRRGRRARERYLQQWTPELVTAELVDTYRAVRRTVPAATA
jgi:glycosyltransferase involved in cell wall biosynthesis